MGTILYMIAFLILFIPISVLNFIAVLIKYVNNFNFLKVVDGYFFNSALNLDKFGNKEFKTLFSLCLIRTNGYLFGDERETISSVLGKNQKQKTLTLFGWFIVYLLWCLDYKYWRKGGHCINSIIEF